MSAAPSLAFVPWKEGALRIEVDRQVTSAHGLSTADLIVRVFVMRGAKWIVVDESALDVSGIRKVWPESINNALRVQR